MKQGLKSSDRCENGCSAEKGEVRGQGDVKGDFEGGWGETEQPKLGNHTWPGTGSWAGRNWHSVL